MRRSSGSGAAASGWPSATTADCTCAENCCSDPRSRIRCTGETCDEGGAGGAAAAGDGC